MKNVCKERLNVEQKTQLAVAVLLAAAIVIAALILVNSW
jgi:hypothetical protein